jgi:hypothetical protein
VDDVGPHHQPRQEGRYQLVDLRRTLSCCRPSCCGVHGRIADEFRAGRTVGLTARCSTDGRGRAALAACAGLTWAARVGLCIPVTARPVTAQDEPRQGRRCADVWSGGLEDCRPCLLGLGPSIFR